MYSTINLDRPEPTLYAKQISVLAERWLADVERRLPSESTTVAGYADKIKYFNEWWQGVGPDCQRQLHQGDLLDYEKHLRTLISRQSGLPLAYNTRKNALRRLRTLFSWAYEQNYIDTDFSTWVPAPDGEPPLKLAPTPADLRKLLNATGISAYPVRDKAIIAVFIGTGIRRAECAGLDIEDVQFHANLSGTLRVRRTKQTAHRSLASERPRIRQIALEVCHAIFRAIRKRRGGKSLFEYSGSKKQRLNQIGHFLRDCGYDERQEKCDRLV